MTPRQFAIVVFVGTFVTVIGAYLLARWFRRRNKKDGQ